MLRVMEKPGAPHAGQGESNLKTRFSVAFFMFFIRVGLAWARISVSARTSPEGEVTAHLKKASSNLSRVSMSLMIGPLFVPFGLRINQ